MQIRHRLMISNFLMFLLPFCLILWVAGSLYFAFQEYRLREVGNLARDKVAVHAVESAMQRTAVAVVLAGDAGERAEPLWNSLAEELLEQHYHFLLLKGTGETVWSNCDELDLHLLGEEAQPVVFQEDGGVYILRSSNIVKYMFRYGTEEYHAIAIMSRDMNAIEQNLWMLFHGYLWLMIGVGLAVLLGVDFWLARQLSRKINLPLQTLREGTMQVKQGNLDIRLECVGDDEFREVAQMFNDMVLRLKESESERQRYAQDRSLLIAGISHDIRTPLTVVKGYVEGLRDGVATTPEKRLEYLGKIYARAVEMEHLVDRLFFYSKLNLGTYPFNFQQVALGDWLRKLVAQMREEESEPVSYIADIPEGSGALVKMDILEMGRVLKNLVRNAKKYAQTDELKISISLEERPQDVILSVADNGIGMTEKECGEIFRAFYRGDHARSGKVKGSGLGLAIAREIVAAHGGHIWAEGNGGLSLHIILPRAEHEESRE